LLVVIKSPRTQPHKQVQNELLGLFIIVVVGSKTSSSMDITKIASTTTLILDAIVITAKWVSAQIITVLSMSQVVVCIAASAINTNQQAHVLPTVPTVVLLRTVSAVSFQVLCITGPPYVSQQMAKQNLVVLKQYSCMSS
jgi:hypothetical protein